MVAHRLTAEGAARLFALGLAIGLPLAALLARWVGQDQAIEIHARVAEAGGWGPAELTATVGQPIRLRLTSDDVMHGFAIGQSDVLAIDVPPGQMIETTLAFDKPGKYVFYCTRWCGLGHWRMRGTIEVSGPTTAPSIETPPLYVTLGLNIDERSDAGVVPDGRPSAGRGSAFEAMRPPAYFALDNYRRHAPAEVWQTLRADKLSSGLSDAEVWDLVAFMWQSNTTPETLAEGKTLYAANCAACHGEAGQGDGIAAESLKRVDHSAQVEFGHNTQAPRDFTDPAKMLSASPALLQGKIIRGGMGTGMPYWGPIFTEAQTWALVDYLWTFQFQYSIP